MNRHEALICLKEPFQDKDWSKKIGIGGLLGFIPVINLSLLGYILEWIVSIHRSTEPSDTRLPEWKEFGKLLANGLIAFGIIFIYSLAPLILLLLGKAIINLGGIAVVLGNIFNFLGGIGFGLVSFILPAILVNFARSKRIETAFHLEAIGEEISRVFLEYMFMYIFSLGLILAGWVIISILSFIIVGYILIPVLNFYICLVMTYGFSKLFRNNFSGGQNDWQ